MLADAATEKPASERMQGSAIPTELGPKQGGAAMAGVKYVVPGAGSRWALWGNPWGQGVAG